MIAAPQTLIIGAGAAGLSAACFCLESTLVVERMGSPGRKLLATGGGRCNFTHDCTPDAMARSFGRNFRFVVPAIYQLAPAKIRDFFQTNGVPSVVQSDGCVFPESQRADDLLQALLQCAKARNVGLQTSVTVKKLIAEVSPDSFRRIVRVETSAGDIFPKRVIMAAGGSSYPTLGSDGSGFKLLADLGLKIEPPLPALAALKTVETWPEKVAGIVLKNGALRICEKDGSKCNGEILFTHEGVSAPPALNLSGEISYLLCRKEGSCVKIELNMDSTRSAELWFALFDSWRGRTGGRSIHNLLSGELPRTLAQLLCCEAGLSDCAIARASKTKLRTLVALLTASPLHIKAVGGWNNAMLTRGGLATAELDPQTLACRSIPNLHCVGEVVDVDGPCGGYNLTWAFASGALAARSA